MAGIYIHIPFCKQACSYCDFHFSTSLKRKGELVQSICKEVELQKDYLKQEEVQSIYFGGGTPSLLNNVEIRAILDQIYRYHQVAKEVEITFEANPDDLNSFKLKELKSSGINRLSIGIQSFFEEDLRLMNRAHDAEQAHVSIKLSQDVGFNNISIDLIYGSPTTTNNMWEQNLAYFFEYHLPHLSSYCLTIEQKTKLHHQLEKREILPPPESKAVEQFDLLQEAVKANKYEQYEVSNFCRDGKYSKHNTSYWKSISFLGLGPSAHSYNGVSRQWNIASNAQYIDKITKSELPSEMEYLSEIDKLNEYLMTSLRTKWGVDFNLVRNKHTSALVNKLKKNILHPLIHETCIYENNKLLIKPQYYIYSDRIIRELFIL